MTNYFNDSPIENATDDKYGISPFAKALAKSILAIEKPVGTAIGLHGPWGSGKSSAVNLIRSELVAAATEDLVIADFKCWWYRGEEAMALAFLQELHTTLKSKIGKAIEKYIPQISRRLLEAGPVLGTAITIATASPWIALIPKFTSFAKTFFSSQTTVESNFKSLSQILSKQNRRFLFIIDDIDRLSPEEALSIFKMVKSIGRLPNVMYLLIFDRQLAEAAVMQRYPSEGPHFLEKIIQASFELPLPLQVDLNNAVLASIIEIAGISNDDLDVRLMNIFYDVVVPYMTTPRHATRFRNAIAVTWPAIAREVNLADFIALETIRLYEPSLFRAIRTRKDLICGTRRQGDPPQNDDSRFDPFLDGAGADRHNLIGRALQRLFPRLESTGYGHEWTRTWASERRICVAEHFDTYFRLALNEEVISAHDLEELLERADDRNFVQTVFRKAAEMTRRSGKSMVPVYLDAITSNAEKVTSFKVQPFMAAIFEIHDEIDSERDKESGFAIGSTSLRFHWLIRQLTKGRFSLDQRTGLYLSALEKSALGWLVDFTSSAKNDHFPGEGKEPIREEDCLVNEQAIPVLSKQTLQAIRTAAENGALLNHKDLFFILYRWKELLDDNPAEVRQWTNQQLQSDQALVIFARALTSRSWSMGIGGLGGSLGDRVARSRIVVQISDDTDILDLPFFVKKLEHLRSHDGLGADALSAITTFLNAWHQRHKDKSLQ